jgi:hypothetical protein
MMVVLPQQRGFKELRFTSPPSRTKTSPLVVAQLTAATARLVRV